MVFTTDTSPNALPFSLVYARDVKEARRYRDAGWEPVECSFGKESVVGPLKLDHHGSLSHEEAVSIKAAKLAVTDPTLTVSRFVAAGMPDPDAVYTILVLSRTIKPSLSIGEAIADLDLDPIGIDRIKGDYVRNILFDMYEERELSREGFLRACHIGRSAFNTDAPSPEDLQRALEYEKRRISEASNAVVLRSSHCILVVSDSVGRDVWHNGEVGASLFVQFKPTLGVITLSGCTLLGSKRMGMPSVFDLLGPVGLETIYPKLDKLIRLEGFGGRPDIGGSPRGALVTLDDAERIYRTLVDRLHSTPYFFRGARLTR